MVGIDTIVTEGIADPARMAIMGLELRRFLEHLGSNTD